LDLEMPGPSRWRGEQLIAALSARKISPIHLHQRVEKLLNLVEKVQRSGPVKELDEQECNTEALRSLNREIATKAIVLLKNDNNILPIRKSKTIAVIGPNSCKRLAMGGGSSSVNPYYFVSALEGIEAFTSKAWPETTVTFNQGCNSHELLPLLEAKRSNGEQGLDIEVFDQHLDFTKRQSSDRMSKSHTRSSRMLFFDKESVPLSVLPVLCMYVSGSFQPKASGKYDFGVITTGRARLFVDGHLVVDNWTKQKPGRQFFGRPWYQQ
jgi:beta-glucosidase